jgi:outer membrane lipopolysaccharide assembly protein LptE/RlpB
MNDWLNSPPKKAVNPELMGTKETSRENPSSTLNTANTKGLANEFQLVLNAVFHLMAPGLEILQVICIQV